MKNNLLFLETLIVSGHDAERFLQGMLTCDVAQLQINNLALGAACNRKGRVIANFFITKTADNVFHLSLPENMIETLLAHFKKYVIAAKVTFTKSEEKKEINVLDEIKNKRPLILPETSELFTPHMLGLEKLGAVSFKKGCYVGQEIVARTEHLGKLKRHLHSLTLPFSEKKKPGDELNMDGKMIGTVVNVATDKNEQHLLAVLKR